MSNIEKVKAIVADALYLEADEVQKDSNLMKDLGAESIDFLDIVFRLEKEFSIKLPKGDIEKRAKGGLSDAEFAVDGRLTPQGIERLKAVMPEVDPAALARGLLVREIPSLFTVATFERMVNEQLLGNNLETATAPASEASAASRM